MSPVRTLPAGARRMAVAMAVAMAVLLAAGGVLPPAAAAGSAAACAGAADFDGDGADDVAVGDPFGDGQKGSVHLLSGAKVTPVAVPGPVKGDGLGWSVRLADVNGDSCADLLVGAPFADVDGEQDAGSVYVVYGGKAAPPQRLTAPQPQRFAHFGWSLAARDDLIVIGAPYEDDGQIEDAGAVYVRQGSDALRRISQETVDVRGNSEVGDQFGWSLAIGPRNGLVVGVPYENDDGAGRQVQAGKIDSGSVVFIDDVLAPRIASLKLDSPTKSSGDRYGYAVAYAEGNGYAVSAPGPGYVQLLDLGRKQTRMVKQGGRQAFGFSMAASSDGRLAVGAPYGGGVQVFSWKNPADDRKLATAEGLFGWSVAFSGNKLFVGQPDGPPYGKVAVAPRNADDVQSVQPPKGTDFGTALAG
ncbi:FG-GAP-like repeat-containing protein [Nonomuraea sp. NPDC049646]|uniref:FG-GAP-like repeat-containing protein n=1 Tax=unclassified Nonomuraea TaxID=2593643 RepID=UPI0037B3B1AD